MPKRKRPSDGEEFSNQLKTYVDTKVINEKSVSSDEAMSIVYEKTKKLLWLGSKLCSNATFPSGPSTSRLSVESRMEDSGQLKIGNKGQLTFQTHPKEQPKMTKGTTHQSCKSCHTRNLSSPCSWCSCNLCTQCSRICHACSGTFCQLCSVLDYQKPYERSCCLQCTLT